MTPRLTPVLRPWQQVEQQLREAIQNSEFKQGERLPTEAALAEGFGVSRSTVREALRALAAEGLIQKSRGASGGSFVQTIDHESLQSLLVGSMGTVVQLGAVSFDEVSGVREVLEVPAARIAAAQRTSDDLDRLAAIVDQQRRAHVDDPEVPSLDVAFHAAVASATRNRALSSFVAALHQTIRPVTLVHLGPDEGRNAVRQHLAILEAIRDQAEDRAAEAMRQHIRYIAGLRVDGTRADRRASIV